MLEFLTTNATELAIQIATGGATGVIAIAAWLTSVEALHSAYRPVLRPVPLKTDTPGHVSGADFLIKNIGVGAGVAVMLFDAADNHILLGEVDVVEPLGEQTDRGEVGRIGRVRMLVRTQRLDDEHTYRLVYQDIAGRWHETRFTPTQSAFIVRFLGPKRWWHVRRNRRIPALAAARGQVAKASEQS